MTGGSQYHNRLLSEEILSRDSGMSQSPAESADRPRI
jgi:hypothetical protein